MRNLVVAIIVFISCLGVGCSKGPARVSPPDVDAILAGEEAVRMNDQNQDGIVTKEELIACPALLASFDSLDGDSSQSLTPAEIESRIKSWQESKAGLVCCRLRLLLDGRPLRSANVSLEPADFMKPGILPAKGITNDQGYVEVSVEEAHLPAPSIRALNWGFYDVKVTDGANGQKVVPEKYGVEKVFGLEVTALGKNEAVLHLSTKK